MDFNQVSRHFSFRVTGKIVKHVVDVLGDCVVQLIAMIEHVLDVHVLDGIEFNLASS